MKISQIISTLEAWAPLALQESYDNAGLLTGSPDWECGGALICLDVTEEVVEEAMEQGFNLVIAHHPLIFRGLKKITGRNYVEKTLIRAIKNDIAVYAIHTNLDNLATGVNASMAAQLGLQDCRVLSPLQGQLKKLYVFVPRDHAPALREAVFAAGAGHIGGYSECSFNTDGVGTFTAGMSANPYVGTPGQPHQEPETRVEVIFPAWLEGSLLEAMRAAHPYEEVAHDLVTLSNAHAGLGAGLLGNLASPLSEKEFLGLLKEKFRVPVIRHSPLKGKALQRVALCGGAGSFLIPNALAANADIFITSDLKYHEFFDAGNSLVLADIGHYESEQFSMDLLAGFLRGKFPTFASLKTRVMTNPVHYF
jgi:dinuclear metal center YbgI/SA1388 family protein